MTKFGIGQSVSRFEDPRLLRGRGCFVDDINLPGQAYAVLVRSPHANAHIRSINLEPALQSPGVLAVYTGDDVAADGLAPIPHATGSSKAGSDMPLRNADGSERLITRQHLLPRERVLSVGEAVVMVVAESLNQARHLWHLRESIPLAQAEEGLNIKHDISIPVSRIPDFVAQTDALLQREIPGVRLVNFGHLGDGNLHYNVQAPEGGDAGVFLREQEDRVNTLVFDSVARFSGSISAEHGIGSLKADKLPRYKSAVALDMMRAIKQALDPNNLMNPDRVVLA